MLPRRESKRWRDRTNKVHEAARECGHTQFKIGFKLLSKFAHPTAMQILALPDPAKTIIQRDYFFSLGCLFFTGAFYALENCLRRLETELDSSS